MPSYEHHKKLLTLLLSDDIENVYVGMELSDTLFDDEEDIFQLLRVHKELYEKSNIPKIPMEDVNHLILYSQDVIDEASNDYLFNIFLQNVKHRQTLDLWLLIKLSSFGILESEKQPTELYIHTQYLPSELHILQSVKKMTIVSKQLSPKLWTLDQVETVVIRTEHSRMYQRSTKHLLRMLHFRRRRGAVSKSLPLELFEGPIANSLRTLDFSYTNINIIPPQIGNLVNLERLEAKETCLQMIPKEILDCKKLTYLDVSLTGYSSLKSTLHLPYRISSLNIKHFCVAGYTVKCHDEDLENLLSRFYVEEGKIVFFLQIEHTHKVRIIQKETVLNCRDIGLLSQVEYIDFSNMSLEDFPEVLFFMTNLKHLNLSKNKFVTLPDNIDSLSKLEYLDVSHNKIVYLPTLINNLSKLKQFHLHNNCLTEIPQIFLQTIDKKFDVSHNQITSLSTINLHTDSLKDVCINNNPITTFPEGFRNHQTIKYINIEQTKISMIPEFFSQFKKLRQFQSKSSLLSTFPKVFLKIIEVPTLTGKRLQIHQDFSFPNSMEKEYKRELFKKYFEHLTPQKAKIVTTLNLSDHGFTQLPERISDLYNLHTLNIAKNELTTLPQGLARLTSLKRIHLTSNALTDLTPLQDLPLLEEIYAKDNCITQFIPTHKFRNLQMLNLSKNRLTSLPKSLDGLKNLIALRLNVNQITYMHDSEHNVFQSLEELPMPICLSCINLGENPITILPRALFESSSLREIYVSKNLNQQQNLERIKSYNQNANWFWIESIGSKQI